MLEKIKQTAKHTSIFAFGKISSKVVGLILLPIYTREISVSDYGALGLLEVIELLGSHVLGVGLYLALMRWHSLEKNEIRQKKIVFSCFFFLLVITLSSIIVILPARHILSTVLFRTDIYGDFLIYVFLSICFTVLAKIPQTILRIEEKSLLFTVSVLCQFTLSLILNIYFVAFLKLGIEGILIAHAISNGLLLLILLPYLMRRMSVGFVGGKLKEMISFGYPFIFSAIAATILNLGDRYLLAYFSTLSEVGLYSLGYKYSNILKILVVDAFVLGLPIVGWKVVRDNQNPKRFFMKTLTYFIFVLLWVGLFVTSYSKGVIHLFALNTEYWDAYKVVPYLVLGVILFGIQQVYFFELQIPQRTKNITYIISTAAILNIVLNLLLIPSYGMMGAAYATVISQLWGLLFAYWTVQRFYPVKYEIKRIIILFLVDIVLFYITLLFDDFSLVWRILIKGIFILSFPVILYFIKFYEPVELDRIQYFIKKWLRIK